MAGSHPRRDRAQLAELQLQRTQKHPQLTEHQILLTAVAPYERIALFDLAKQLKWDPLYTDAIARSIEALDLIYADSFMAEDYFFISSTGMHTLITLGILREDGIATHSLINT